jgi:hypothetical protein
MDIAYCKTAEESDKDGGSNSGKPGNNSAVHYQGLPHFFSSTFVNFHRQFVPVVSKQVGVNQTTACHILD